MTDDKLIALGREFEAYAQDTTHHCGNEPETPEADAAEDERLREWTTKIYNALIDEKAMTPEGLDVKLAAIANANWNGELSWDDRVDQTTNFSDALAWSIVRDLAAMHAKKA